jgi:hypothetical protein
VKPGVVGVDDRGAAATSRRRIGAGVARGQRCGREDRSSIPAAPSSRQRWAQRFAVSQDTWNRSAARATGQPSSTMSLPSRSRARGSGPR